MALCTDRGDLEWFTEKKDETAGLRSQSGLWMAAPPVEGGPCVRGPACLMGIRHAANGRAARGAHGRGTHTKTSDAHS